MIDDGELGRIREVFREFDVEMRHLRGQVIREDLEGDYDVVVATVKRILDLEGAIDLGGLAGKPTWIAVHGQDFLPLRVRLRKLGVHFLVQSSVGIEALRLLLIHALYQGPEKRDDPRLPVGSTVLYARDGRSPACAELLDLTPTSCRLVTAEPLRPGAALSIDLPSHLAGGHELALPGRVVREDPITGSDQHLVVVEFGEIAPEQLELLEAILEGKVIGTLVTRLGSELSEETAALTVPSASPTREARAAAEPENAPSEYPHTRHHPRVRYTRQVTMLMGGGEYVILGRDLSIHGMRAEPVPELPVGTAAELAIYGASGAEPVLVQAVVSRDDGPLGTVFRFEGMADWDRPRLQKIIDTTAKIHSLSGNQDGAPVVMSRLTRRNR